MSTDKKPRYSYSRIDCYDQCAFRYYLKYIEGNYSTAGSIAFDFGTLLHATEEKIGNCIKDGKEIPYDALIKNFLDECVHIKEKWPEAFEEKDKSNRTYAQKIDFYVNKGIYRLERFLKLNPELEIVGCEVPFNFVFENGEAFRGSIDRVLHDKITDQYIVQDIKSYATPLKDNGPGDRDEHLVTPLQFVVYCTAMNKIYGVDPRNILCGYDLPLADTIQEAGTKGFIDRGYKKINKIFDGIYTQNWEPNQTPLCHWCEFCPTNAAADEKTKHLCPYFSYYTKEKPIHNHESEWMGMENHKAIVEAYHKRYGIKQ